MEFRLIAEAIVEKMAWQRTQISFLEMENEKLKKELEVAREKNMFLAGQRDCNEGMAVLDNGIEEV